MLVKKFQFTDLMFNQVPQFAMQIRMAFIFYWRVDTPESRLSFMISFTKFQTYVTHQKSMKNLKNNLWLNMVLKWTITMGRSKTLTFACSD